MAAYFSDLARGFRTTMAGRSNRRPAVEFAGLAASVGRVFAEIVVFLWAALVLAFSGLVAAGFLLA